MAGAMYAAADPVKPTAYNKPSPFDFQGRFLSEATIFTGHTLGYLDHGCTNAVAT